MITVTISYTARSPHPSSEWTRFHDTKHHFPDLASAFAWLKDEYWYCKKRKPCYVDTTSRGTVQNGWIYCYKERDGGKTTYRHDWVSLYDVTSSVVDVTAA